MTSITRNNELNSVVASLLAPTVVSQISKPSASALLSQQDGGGTGAPAFAVPSHKADVPLEFAPLSSGSTGTQQSLPSPIEAAFSLQATSQPDASAVAGPVMIGQESPAAPAIMAPSFAFGGEGAQAIQSAEPAVLMDPVTAPVLAVAIAHDDTVGFFCMCTACTGADAKPTPPAIIGPAAGDDIPDDITSTVTIAVGGTLSSSIQSAGDKDYIKVSLVAGQTYTFSLESTGLVDPYVELRDGSNVLLKDNDDGGILYDSFLTYTPTVSGDYFIVARDYGSDTGGYALTVEAITTGNSSPTTFISNGKTLYSWDESAIQISRTGASWATDFDSSAVVTYAYRSTAPTTMPSDTAGFTRFTAAQIAANDAALAAWAEVANITFVRVGTGTAGEAAYSNTATMLFSNYGSGASGAAAFAYLPSTANTASSSAQGDVWINSSLSYNANPVIGEYGPHVLLHEIGHAIGLSHPGEYNAAPGVSITYPANAEYFNDSRMFTSMSYFGSSSTGGNLQAFASTPSLHDIAAAQRLYGANMTTRTGDTVYGFNSNTGVAAFVLTLPSQVSVFSIWDAGGNDTLDLSGYTQNATIDLREEAFTSAGGGTHNISIARGAVIENAIGGSGNDTVTGNAANNTLNGGVGFDTLNGNDGNDLLLGGAGGDVLNGGAGTDTVSYETSSDYVFVDLQSGTIFGGDASSDTISGVENIIGTNFNDTLGGDANANTLSGLAGNDTLVGRGGNDTIDTGSGDDIVDGGDGNDTINLGAVFTALDSINGGADSDTLNLNGDYSAGITLSDTTLTNVERINLTAGNSYRLTLADATVAAGTQLIIDGSTLAAGQTLTVIGTAETDGTFDLRGGAVNDILSGGAGADTLAGGGGNDILDGGSGTDTASFNVASTSVAFSRALSGNWSVNAGLDGVDTLTGMELLQFTNRTLALRPAEGSIDGNGTSDIMLRNTSGTIALWTMSGASVTGAQIVAASDPGFAALGQGDFNGDGRFDLLFRNEGGILAQWQMNDASVSAVGAYFTDPTWSVAGIGDFNGDFRDDILWRNSSGLLAQWQMDGLAASAIGVFAASDPAWSVSQVADFNGDGRDDILWRKSSGLLAMWQMDGFAVASAGVIAASDPTWQIVGTGDFNGDLREDILWRSSGGVLAQWTMDGSDVTSVGTFAISDLAWDVSDLGDYNGDGRDDILWQGPDGTFALWTLDGFTVTSAGIIGNPGSGWTDFG